MLEKRFVSEKSLVEVYGKDNIFWVGYCGGQMSLSHICPVYYNCGTYGWNFDGYLIKDCLILTGYRSCRNFQRLEGIEYLENGYYFIKGGDAILCHSRELEKTDFEDMINFVIEWNYDRKRGYQPKDNALLKNAIGTKFDFICSKRGLYFDSASYYRYFIGEEKMPKK